MNDITVRFSGEGGEGPISAGEILGKTLVRSGLDIFTFQSLPAEIKGGNAWYQIRAARHNPQSQGDLVHLLVCWDSEAFGLHHKVTGTEGVLLHDAKFNPPIAHDGTVYAIPFDRISRDIGNPRSKNAVVLGAICALLSVPLENLESEMWRRWGKAGEKLMNLNLAAARAGNEYARTKVERTDSLSLETGAALTEMILHGNQAITLGAIAAGCDFFAGYPITPASSILEQLAEDLPRLGGTVLQVEDEIAALGAVLGGSFAGRKAMTATAGPGVSLMSEMIGLSSMAEIPCVIVDAMRGGPSTGLPTKVEQSDLNLAVYGSHGDAPRIVLAPSTVEECFYMTVDAFNLAELCQMPVFLLTDSSLANRAQTMRRPDVSSLKIVHRMRPADMNGGSGTNGDYKRYLNTDDGASPFAFPGQDDAFYTATGLEHDEYGHPNMRPENHTKMSVKRWHKLEIARKEGPRPRYYGDDSAELGIITWGSGEGSAVEAIQLAAAKGLPVAGMQLRMLSPFHDDEIRAFYDKRKLVIVTELNFTGQLAHKLRGDLGLERVVSFTKCEGLAFSPLEILGKIEATASNL